MSNSTAILLAGAMVALAVFFGLRGLAPSDAGSPRGPDPAPPLDPAVVQQRIANALAYHRARLERECYLPAVAGEAPPPRVAFEFNFTFDRAGVQVTRGVVEVAGASRPSVTECVLAGLPPLRIQPPGQLVTATIPLSFP